MGKDSRFDIRKNRKQGGCGMLRSPFEVFYIAQEKMGGKGERGCVANGLHW